MTNASLNLASFEAWLEDRQRWALAGMHTSTATEFARYLDVFESVTTARTVLFRYEVDAATQPRAFEQVDAAGRQQ
jgi:hypothetical protein